MKRCEIMNNKESPIHFWDETGNWELSDYRLMLCHVISKYLPDYQRPGNMVLNAVSLHSRFKTGYLFAMLTNSVYLFQIKATCFSIIFHIHVDINSFLLCLAFYWSFIDTSISSIVHCICIPYTSPMQCMSSAWVTLSMA